METPPPVLSLPSVPHVSPCHLFRQMSHRPDHRLPPGREKRPKLASLPAWGSGCNHVSIRSGGWQVRTESTVTSSPGLDGEEREEERERGEGREIEKEGRKEREGGREGWRGEGREFSKQVAVSG